MGIVVRFRQRHGRASAVSRAANEVSISAVNSASAAVEVASKAAHHSAGTISRCHHLETVQAPAPGMSAANASREGHSSMIFLNEDKSDMSRLLGRSVLNCKDILALDGENRLGHTVPMTETDSEHQYKQEFIQRVKSARIATGMKQWQVAELLNIPQDKYKHYEVGRLVPHYLIGRFCVVCRVDPVWLVTGKGPKPLRAPHVVASEEAPIRKPKRTARSKVA